jgi:hypothetical protein
VQPLLTPAILGSEQLVLRPDDQTLIARWALKTAILLRFTRERADPPSDERTSWVMTNSSPPPQTGVWLGAYGGSAQAHVHLARHALDPPQGLSIRAFHAELAILNLGRLAVLVLDIPNADRDVLIGTYEPTFERFTVKLWPRLGYNVRWPPVLGLTDDGFGKLAAALENGLIQVFVGAQEFTARPLD